MIKFINHNNEAPFKKFRGLYDLALKNNQSLIEAVLIASYDIENKEVDARYVNLKFIDNNKFIFFSNYESPKSKQFSSHNQISAVFYWQSINTQVRIKAKISKSSEDFSNQYFENRNIEKNALAISSKQSKSIESYERVKENYFSSLKNKNLTIRPDYWGGFKFIPYYFEFWEGNDRRINKREAYKLSKHKWSSHYLQP